jgi:hypothetical protein
MQHACETAGAARIRSSPRPLFGERADEMKNFGRIAPREGEAVSITVIPGDAKHRTRNLEIPRCALRI